MATATTTLKLVRDNKVTLIEALTPTLAANRAFKIYHGDHGIPLEDWALAHPDACWRRFSLRWEDDDPHRETDLQIVEEFATLRLVIAYPHHMSLYGSDARNLRDMDDMIRSDRNQIEDAVGTNSQNLATGENASRTERQPNEILESDEGQRVTLAVTDFRVQYYRTVNT